MIFVLLPPRMRLVLCSVCLSVCSSCLGSQFFRSVAFARTDRRTDADENHIRFSIILHVPVSATPSVARRIKLTRVTIRDAWWEGVSSFAEIAKRFFCHDVQCFTRYNYIVVVTAVQSSVSQVYVFASVTLALCVEASNYTSIIVVFFLAS